VILTQNIDGLHQDAGSKRVYELHGSTRRYFCTGCQKFYSISRISIPKGVPHCKECGAILKPDVVLYEEPLDEDLLEEAVDELRYADVLIVGGTSLNVYPAAGLINYFGGRPGSSSTKNRPPSIRRFDYVFHEDIGKVLTELLHS
jgi:NAD-dependent deacetylase